MPFAAPLPHSASELARTCSATIQSSSSDCRRPFALQSRVLVVRMQSHTGHSVAPSAGDASACAQSVMMAVLSTGQPI